MRHKFGYRKLNKTGEHRKALFQNMLNSLINYEQIITTLPKAKELKPKIDKVITIGKNSNLSKLRDSLKVAVTTLIDISETDTSLSTKDRARKTLVEINRILNK